MQATQLGGVENYFPFESSQIYSESVQPLTIPNASQNFAAPYMQPMEQLDIFGPFIGMNSGDDAWFFRETSLFDIQPNDYLNLMVNDVVLTV